MLKLNLLQQACAIDRYDIEHIKKEVDIMMKGIRKFLDTPASFLIIKLSLMLAIIVLCILSFFLNEKLLGYGMIGAGLLVLTYGMESKVRNQENVTLLVGVIAAIVFFIFSGYILTNPLVSI